MNLDDAREHLEQIPVNRDATFAHQDYVDEGRRLQAARDVAALRKLEDALVALLIGGTDSETMVAADALMALSAGDETSRSLTAALGSLQSPLRRDAATRVLCASKLPETVFPSLQALFLSRPRDFLRLAIVLLPHVQGDERESFLRILLDVTSASDDADEIAIVIRSALAAGVVDRLLHALKSKPVATVREAALRTSAEALILEPLGIETVEAGLERAFAACSDPVTLPLLINKAVAAGRSNLIPRALKRKDVALLQQATSWADEEARPWLEAMLSSITTSH